MNVSLNAQQYTPTPMAFFAAPSTAALSPTSGPLLGGTNITITAAALPLAFAEATQCAVGGRPNPHPEPEPEPEPEPDPDPRL